MKRTRRGAPAALALAGLVAGAACGLLGPAPASGQGPAGSAADWEALKRKLSQPGGGGQAPPEADLFEPSDSEIYGIPEVGAGLDGDEGLAGQDGLAGSELSPDSWGSRSGRPSRARQTADEPAQDALLDMTDERPQVPEWEREVDWEPGTAGERPDLGLRLLEAGADAESVERVRRGLVDEELILRLEDEGVDRDLTERLRSGMYAPADLSDIPRTDSPMQE